MEKISDVKNVDSETVLNLLPEAFVNAITTTDLVKLILGNQKWQQGLKSIVNKILYALEKQKLVFRIEGTPPKWFKVVQEKQLTRKDNDVVEKQHVIYVYIDQVNYQCLEQAVSYAGDNVNLIAFFSSLHVGLVPPNNVAGVTFEMFDSEDHARESREIKYCMHMTKVCENRDPSLCTFIVASRNKVIQLMAQEHQRKYGVEVFNVQDWEELKTHLE
jgi:hypothetical protein